MRLRPFSQAKLLALAALGTIALCAASCDPVTGSGPGSPPDPKQFLRVDQSTRSAVVTLIAGHPATDSAFNYNGYANGDLVLQVPVGWRMTVQCENHSTVPNSCAVVSDRGATAAIDPGWSTPDPRRGLDPGQSDAFEFTPSAPGSFRIASLVDGSEASGMWADLEVTSGRVPKLTADG